MLPTNNPTVRDFVLHSKQPRSEASRPTAVSLFSGGGVSDYGYALAGFEVVLQAEIEPRRAAIARRNFPDAVQVVGDIRTNKDAIVEEVRRRVPGGVDLLVATPPCQGMSSSNPSRGKRHDGVAAHQETKNRLILDAVDIVRDLTPPVAVFENVRQIRTLSVTELGATVRLIDLVRERLGPRYRVFDDTIDVADYGIPQHRFRAVIVAVRADLTEHLVERPLPPATHKAGRVNLNDWLQQIGYEPLDSVHANSAHGTHPLHFVPTYSERRYRLIADIPANSGRSAYENEHCPSCGDRAPHGAAAVCEACGVELFNRPIVLDDGQYRLVKGFKSSYRRMPAAAPAPTVTTAMGHVGSDQTIHPYENRLLSILECADLQTIPRCFDWSSAVGPESGKRLWNVVRDVIGEAFPTYFTYLHGRVLLELLNRHQNPEPRPDSKCAG